MEKCQYCTEMADALEDAITLLAGWIANNCPIEYRAQHLADLDKKRATLAKARSADDPPTHNYGDGTTTERD